jgi:hypothetical protein
MSTRPRKFNEFPSMAANTIASGDLWLVEDISAGITKVANTATLNTYYSSQIAPRGPYADDAAASTAGVGVGKMYYTSAGIVRVRLA